MCNEHSEVQIKLPSPNRAFITFNKTVQQYRIPIVIYADFESLLLPFSDTNVDSTTRTKYQIHKPNSYCILIKSTLKEEHLQIYGLTTKPQVYRGEHAAKTFVDNLYDIAAKVERL